MCYNCLIGLLAFALPLSWTWWYCLQRQQRGVHVVVGFAEVASLTSSGSCWCSVPKVIEMSFAIRTGLLRDYRDSRGWCSSIGGYLWGSHDLPYEQPPGDDQDRGPQLSFDADSCSG